MNKNNYGEIINGIDTYKHIAKVLTDDNPYNLGGRYLIGWTDGDYDHRDILFVYDPLKAGDNLQRGLRWCNLFISIMDYSCMGFCIEMLTDNRKANGYIKEKLHLNNNSCDDKICELINGVIHEMDLIIGNVKGEENENN